jgi:hypothetical protein
VSGSHIFTQLTAGSYHTCGLLGGGSALCWGGYGVQSMVLRLHCGPGLVLCPRPLGLPCVAALTPSVAWPGFAAACPQRAKHCMCGCFTMQVLVCMGSLAITPLYSKLPQWLCLAHTPSHSYQRVVNTLVDCLATGLRCAGVSMACRP